MSKAKNKKAFNTKNLKRILIIGICFVLIFAVIGPGGAVPYLSVIPDMVKVGVDYISLNRRKDAPDKYQLISDIEKRETEHPFIFADEELFGALRREYSGEPDSEYVNSLYSYVFANAQALLNTENYPVLPYVLDEEDSILPISREVINRMIILGFAYNVSGDERFAERAWAELENVCSYDDWCPSHFLATAEMALAVSIGYDWFFDYLSSEQKTLLCNKTWEYAITPALSKNYLKNWFIWSKNNWNSICYSGIGIACMTFADYDTEKAAEFLSMCYKNMPIAFESFVPDGVYAEGPGYCQSGMNSIVYFICSSINYFETDYGMSETDGFRQLGYFPVYINGSKGMFNFGDNKNRECFTPSLHWYAARYDSPLLSAYQSDDVPGEFCSDASENTEKNGTGKDCALSLLWYNRSFDSDTDFSAEPLAVYLESELGQDIVIMRSNYRDENATYAAIKGGYNFINHGDLDIGTFVFDSMGERWAEELGPGNYDAPGYFMNLPAGGRWKYYSKRAEGQNTLVINPDFTIDDQYVLAEAEVVAFEESDDGGAAKIDMTDAYSMNMAKSVVREFELFDNRSSLRISDTVECLVRSDIYWFMHTRAEIEISADGKTAILTINGKQMRAQLHNDGVFSVTDPISVNGKNEYDGDFEGIRRLTVFLEGVKSAKITVTLEPVC